MYISTKKARLNAASTLNVYDLTIDLCLWLACWMKWMFHL